MAENSVAQSCDSTLYFSRHYYFLKGKDEKMFFKKIEPLISNKCFIHILDSINKINVSQSLDFISDYYYFVKSFPDVNSFIADAVDSTISARISYHIADTNNYLASRYRSYFTNIEKQYEWILNHNKRSREILRKYILLQDKEVEDISWLKFVCMIKDSIAFNHAFNITKNNKNSIDYAKNFEILINMGMDCFGNYSLFEDNLNELIKISKYGASLANRIIDGLPGKVNYKYAKKIFNKVILNKKFMQMDSGIGELVRDGASASIFNYNFIRGIEVYYPELLKTKEYKSSCKNSYCFFDEKLYALLVKTIKRKK